MNATAALKYLEGYYFYWNSKDYIPRTLDPMEEVYWIGQYSIEYLVKKVRNFTTRHIQSMIMKLRQKLEKGFARVPPKKSNFYCVN